MQPTLFLDITIENCMLLVHLLNFRGNDNPVKKQYTPS